MCGALEHCVWCPCVHHIENAVICLVAACAKERGSQDFLCVGIDQYFHEALRLAFPERAGYILHGDSTDTCAATASSDLRLSHAGSAQRRIGVERIGGNTLAHSSMLTIDQIGGDDLEIVPGRVSEAASAVAVATRSDAGNIG